MPSGPPVRLTILGLGLALGWGVVALAPGVAGAQQGRADDPGVRTIYYPKPAFRIPVTIPAEGRDVVRQVRLWVSDDRGQNWKEVGQVTPLQSEFPFRATRDAEYWFALQTVDIRGKIYPSDDRPVDPSLKVVVDTTQPTIVLEPKGRRGGLAAVAWDARDGLLDPRTFALEYQPLGAGEADWRSVPLGGGDMDLVGSQSDFRLVGKKTWDAGTAEAIRVRASVKDRAGNLRAVELELPGGAASAPGAASLDPRAFDGPPPVQPISARTPRPDDDSEPLADPFASIDQPEPTAAGPEVAAEEPAEPSTATATATPAPSPTNPLPTLQAGASRFALQYAIDDAGPAGVAKVQLWVTHDGGRTWYPQPEDADKTSPYLVDVGGEGTFGLRLCVQGLSGLGDTPPAPNDPPELWVEVDSSPPLVQVYPPRVGTGRSAGKVLIAWRASDPHLAARPVTILYRGEDSDAAWTPVADQLENTGQYIWAVPPGVPPRFRIKVEVSDTLGHRGVAETGPVLVDRARPKGRIIGLDPAARGDSGARR
jgi:hypothetical protein